MPELGKVMHTGVLCKTSSKRQQQTKQKPASFLEGQGHTWDPYNQHYIIGTADPFETKLSLVVHHRQLVSCKKIGLMCSRSTSRSQQKVQGCSECYSCDIF